MRRRDLITAGITAAAAVVMPRLARAERSNKLVFAPTNDLTTLDPVVTFARPTRNHGYLVFDTLYGIDADWRTRPQMVEGHRVEDDGSTWTLILRDGLRFHDGYRLCWGAMSSLVSVALHSASVSRTRCWRRLENYPLPTIGRCSSG